MEEAQHIDGDWYGYKRKTGEIAFFYNKKTCEHKLPNYTLSSPTSSSNEITINVEELEPIEVHSVGIQTAESDCDKGCTSMYIDPSLVTHEKISFEQTIEEAEGSATSSTTDATSNGYIEPTLVQDTHPSTEHTLVKLQSTEDVDFEGEVFTYDDHCIEEDLEQSDVKFETLGTTTVICELCSLGLESTEGYEDHLVTHCTEESKQLKQCPVCHKTLKSRKNLLDHIRSHSGHKPFKCIDCKKAFRKKQQLERHINSHKLVKPFKCSHCEKTFGAQLNLRIHERIHSHAKPYVCTQCDKAFTQQHHLKRHRRMHAGTKPKPFECTRCSKTFTELHHLKDHERIHSEVKPYKCEYCDKSFTVRATLKNHERIHTGARPYQCKICEKAFKQYGSLKKHDNVHKNKSLLHVG